ncbi:MAG: hypothetical protein NDJ92_02580 [Thermoanaerobaculia bacterium]|nr:hypothetical protein [Thermoanaerobaculia bacterium]
MTGNEPVSRIKLPGGPEQTVSSIIVDERSAVAFEFFDFSPAAQEHFGNDIAISIVVAPSARAALAVALGLPEGAGDAALLGACAARFQSYFDVQPWLEQNDIPYEKKFESHA